MGFNHLESDPKPPVPWFLVTPSSTAASPMGLFYLYDRATAETMLQAFHMVSMSWVQRKTLRKTTFPNLVCIRWRAARWCPAGKM